MELSDTVWTRLYKKDLEQLDKMCEELERKRSQVVRMLVNRALKNELLYSDSIRLTHDN